MNNTALIQSRMKSIRQTVQISNAQKLIAASRIGRARRMQAESAPFHERIRQNIAGVLALCPEVASHYLTPPGFEQKRRGLLVISSDRGLAGGYTFNLVKCAEQSLLECPSERVIVLGQMGRNQLENLGVRTDPLSGHAMEPPTIFQARELAEQLCRLFDGGQVDSFDVVYTHYYSTVRLKPTVAKLFPLAPEAFGEPGGMPRDVVFEPSPEAVLSMLIPKYLKGFIYGCLVHAWASELASRITAMDSAIRNGSEMLDKLSLQFNRARQALITQEITEIVAGAASMSGKD